MLFDFEPVSVPTLTMEDVRFPLDILFISPMRDVIAIVHALPGQRLIEGPRNTRWVLEVPGGYAARHGLRVGARLTIRS